MKLDNLIQIAHNVEIDEHTVIAAQTGIAGSTKVGKFVKMGGQAALSGHIKIGDHVVISGKTGVRKNVKDNDIVIGFPAFNIQKWNRSSAIFRNLPEYVDKIKELEKEIKALKEK